MHSVTDRRTERQKEHYETERYDADSLSVQYDRLNILCLEMSRHKHSLDFVVTRVFM